MSISKTQDVFNLVKSLSKAEKRTFRIYANRVQDDGDLMYLKLFDIFEKQKEYDDKQIKDSIKNLDQSQYANLKRHLYQQILISLRLVHKERKANIKIREQIDFAYILYGKGLYMQALKILGKAKKLARKHQNDISLLTIVEFEKTIQSRHITRSKSQPILQLVDETAALSNSLSQRISLSNLRLTLHKYYVEKGHVHNKEEYDKIVAYFKDKLPSIKNTNLGHMEQVYLYQSYVWYYYILNDFKKCKDYALKWVKIFRESDELQNRDVNLYMRGYHYLLTCLFNLKDSRQFNKYLLEFEHFRKSNYPKFNKNTQIISFLYVHSGRLNKHFLEGSFEEGCERLQSTLQRIKRYDKKLDKHKVMVLYFKVAWMYLGNNQAEKAIKYLMHIIDNSSLSLREDIQGYARLMFLMAHYDLENYNLLIPLVKKYDRYFKKMKEQNQLQKIVLQLFKALSTAPILERKNIFISYHKELTLLSKSTFEKRAFIYLEIIPYTLSKITGKSLQETIKDNNALLKKSYS